MFYYLYKTTNLINNRFYIGVRKSIIDPYKDPYLGSGKLLKQAISLYGKNNFSKEILSQFSSFSEAFTAESKIVNNLLVDDPLSYNLVVGGLGGDHWSNLANRDEILALRIAKQKEYMALLTKDQRKAKFGNTKEKNGFFGKSHTTERIENFRASSAKYEYCVTSPAGVEYNIISLVTFCKENNLNRDILMKYINKGIVPSPSNYGKLTRMNTVGWSINAKLKDITSGGAAAS